MTPPPPPMSPSGPPPPAKKSKVLLWVLLGVGGFFFLIVVGLLAGGLFVAHKIRQDNFVFKSADGSFQIGGAAKVPAWLPEYPGSNPKSIFSARNKDVRSGTFIFTTQDSPDHVAQYYRDQLEAAGFTIAAATNTGRGQVITAQDHSKDRTVNVVVSRGATSETSVNVTYTNK
jgi:hypothetical protein